MAQCLPHSDALETWGSSINHEYEFISSQEKFPENNTLSPIGIFLKNPPLLNLQGNPGCLDL